MTNSELKRPTIWGVCRKWGQEMSIAASHLLFPPACLICGIELSATLIGTRRERLLAERLCPRCDLELGLNGTRCQLCGLPSSEVSDCTGCRWLCTRLHLPASPWQRLFVLGGYTGSLRDTVLQAKRPAGEDLADLLAMLLLRQHNDFEQITVDAVVPVPMHWRRRFIRRTNAAAVIANRLAGELGVPVKKSIRKAKLTPLQRSLPAAERIKNVAGSFRIRGRQPLGAKVLVIDDVATTGATLAAATAALLEAGVSVVYAAVIARADLASAADDLEAFP